MTQQIKPDGNHDADFMRMMSNITASMVANTSNDEIIKGPEITRAALGIRKADDTGTNSSHNNNMEYVPRDELNAKLETIEAKMDGRIARIEDAVERISKDNAATRAGISDLKKTMVVTAITAVLAIVLGIAAFNATLTSNMLSAFQAGQQTSTQAKK